MSKAEIIPLRSSTNKVEAIRQVIQTICIFRFRDVTGRELDLLCELIRCGGVNDKAKKSFMLNYKTTKENYGQLIKRLADKGILINNEMRNGKKLQDSFLHFIEFYLNNPEEHILLVSWKIDS